MKRLYLSLLFASIILIASVIMSKMAPTIYFIPPLYFLIVLIVLPVNGLVRILPFNIQSLIHIQNNFLFGLNIFGFVYIFLSSFIIIYSILFLLEKIKNIFPDSKKLNKNIIIFSVIAVFIIIISLYLYIMVFISPYNLP